MFLKKLGKNQKLIYYSDLIKNCGNDSKHKWRILKEISSKMKTSNNSLPKTIKIGGQTYYEPKEIANEFNKFFTQVGPILANKIPEVNTQFEEYLAQYVNVLDFQTLTFKGLETAFKTLKRNKASGYDDISSNIVINAYNEIKQIVFKIFEKGEFTLGVFIDLSKAFDTVDYNILIKKIEKYGINGNILKLLKNSLHNRKQYVFYDIKNKDLLSITCGVFQGSILGPLLFLIYVNDLFRASSLLNEIMFGDDTNLFMSNSNIEQLFLDMNIELTKITTWFKANRLSLNVKKKKKKKWTLFHSSWRKRFIPELLPDLIIDDLVIEREKVTKFLGVLIDENLN